jgi:endo-1,4-beta-xylanase
MMIGVVKETLDPDIEETDVVGPVQQLYPEYDWGSLAVWAWGCSRVMDYAETRNDVQLNHVIVKGHSRTGKAALIAGAFDERFAITSSNGGGMGGPAVHRITNPNSDQLSSATFYHWFQESLEDFIDKEDKLPFDQHWLAGLVAPRYLLITNGIDDNWANVLGQQACCEAAQHIFDALGADQIGIHFRDGGHDTNEDYTETLDYADWKFFGIPTARNFNNYLFVYTPGYTWTTPTLY